MAALGSKVIRPEILQEDLQEIVASNLPFENFNGQTVLISGANGFLPAYLVDTFLQLEKSHGYKIKVVALVRNLEKASLRFSHHKGNKSLSYVVQDVCDPIDDKSIHANIVIHAASQATPAVFRKDPVGTLKANTLGTINLLDWSVKNNVQTFLQFSSGEVYGQVPEEQIPISETTYGYLDCATVRSCYAESKRMAETACVSYFHQYNLATKIVRPFHTYGPGMSLSDGRVFSDFVSNILNGQHIKLFSDGSVRRPFCYLVDATLGFLTVLLRGQPGQAYNVGNPYEEVSILELAERLVRLFPQKNLVVEKHSRTSNDPYIQSPIQRNSPMIKKILDLGWAPKYSIEKGFKRTIESFYVN